MLFIARMLSVVQAIQPHPVLSLASSSEPGDVAAALEARRSSSSRGISCTPIENNGRSLWGGAFDANRSRTARGTLERTERSYTVKTISTDSNHGLETYQNYKSLQRVHVL